MLAPDAEQREAGPLDTSGMHARLEQRVQVAAVGGQAQRVEVVLLEICILPCAPADSQNRQPASATGAVLLSPRNCFPHMQHTPLPVCSMPPVLDACRILPTRVITAMRSQKEEGCSAVMQ